MTRLRTINIISSLSFILGALIILTSSCTSEQKKIIDSTNKKYGGIFKINAPQGYPFTFYPPHAIIGGSIAMVNVSLETLLKYSDDGSTIEGLLAESWEINEAGDEYTIKIKENIYFHDDPCFDNGEGRELVSKDVAFCLTELCTPGKLNKNSRLVSERIIGGLDRIDEVEGAYDEKYLSGIEIIDDYTLKIKLVGPSYSFTNYLTHYATSIYPEEALLQYGDDIQTRMIGTGPFILKTSVPGKTVIFVRNDNYWMEDEDGNPLPYVDGVKFTFESDANKLVRSANDQRIDLMLSPTNKIISKLNIVEQGDSSSTGFRIQNSPSMDIRYLGFLLTDSIYNNIKVRKAFNMAIDRQMIIDSVLNGEGEIANYGIIPRTFREYEVKEGYEYNPEKARSLMREAGYNETNKFPSQTLHITKSDEVLSIAQLVQNMLSKNIGVYADLSALDTDNHYQKFIEGKLAFAVDRWKADYYDVDNFLQLYVSYLTPEDGGLNLARFRNQEFDLLYQQGLTEFDEAKRMDLFSQANTILYENAALMPIYTSKTKSLQSSRTNNLQIINSTKIPLTEVYLSR